MHKPINAPEKAFKAIPQSNNCEIAPRDIFLETHNKTRQLSKAPQKAARGSIKYCAIWKNEDVRIVRATARAAPLETPNKAGSANGFLKSPCAKAPANPKLAPTNIDMNALGILICQRMGE